MAKYDADLRITVLEKTEWFVCPSHATGSSWDETKRYTWKATQGRGYIAGGGEMIYPTREAAEAAADRLTAANEPF
jgi:hypothetical protein